jgi:peptide/nickel transport system ATP-binding protein
MRSGSLIQDIALGDSPALEARDLTKHFPVHGGNLLTNARGHYVHAVEAVSLALKPGHVIALVGESGSGKTSVGRLLARLDTPTSGEVALHGRQVTKARGRKLREYRREVQVVFQDPFASLNPVHTIAYHLARPLRIHHRVDRRNVEAEIVRLLARVQLPATRQFAAKLPQQLSGGQRQRVAIARALAARPSVLLADEPVSMLDVSIRLSVLNLLAGLVHDDGLALLYITHDIASVLRRHDLCDVRRPHRREWAGRTSGKPSGTSVHRTAHLGGTRPRRSPPERRNAGG